jgi:hypothetical protein
VFTQPIIGDVPPAASMRPGDWLVVLQRKGMQYDASRQMLRWEHEQTVSAELKLLESGYALFRIN